MTTDEQLLDFDASRLEHFDRDEAERALGSEHADLYRNHLVIAHWIDGWVERNSQGLMSEGAEDWNRALREVAAHLRQGDLLPGGVMYEETLEALAGE